MTRYLITGSAGFVGSNFVRQVLAEERDAWIIAYDVLTYAGNLENLSGCLDDKRLRFVQGDICDGAAVRSLLDEGVDVIVNFAAESHVDRSIMGCKEFMRTNVLGAQVLLDEARARGAGLFVQVSTDEVYGSLGPTGKSTECSPLCPTNPYSASKAAADLLAYAYYRIHGLPVIITRCSNNYGPYQFPEKLIPLFISNLLDSRRVPLYGRGEHIRDWIHVSDHCRAIRMVIHGGRPGEVYNIGGNNERTNLELTRLLLAALQCKEDMIEFVADRPGHDCRYSQDTSKIAQELGWKPMVDFESGLADTVAWYLRHQDWWRRSKARNAPQYCWNLYERNRCDGSGKAGYTQGASRS